ncbi:MAG: hybrid sensor histidine kinase/response regulator [Thermotogota bacterium]|nr:hybrid sensor histidine kinase/response regulator [Thermotogota bacterium]
MRKTKYSYAKRIVNILNILKSNEDDATIFRKICVEIMNAYPFIDKASFWVVKSDGEHYISGVGYEDSQYSDLVIPLNESLSAAAPEENVKIVDTAYFPEGFPKDVKQTILNTGIIENLSKSLQIRLKPFGDYFGVLCFDVLDYTDQFEGEIIDEMEYTIVAINAFLEIRITLNNKMSENLYRDHLVASISHDVRTPLTVIMGYIELMQSLMEDNPEILGFLNIMEEQSNYLLNIISDLITLSKINSGNYTINPQKTNIRELINITMKGLKILAKKKRLKFTTHISSSVPTMSYIDRTVLKKILNNLIANAIKYTDKGQISLECHLESKDYIKFVISDTGPGIAKERLFSIFEKYSREQSTINRPGTGLGLSICKELTEELNGSIWAQSIPGKGSDFHLLLPVNASNAADIEHSKKKSQDLSLKDKNILLIEDDIENLHVYDLILKNAGAVCHSYTDPNEALKKSLISTNIDYILIDLILSKGASLDFISKIKEKFPTKKIIAFTGSSDHSLQHKAMDVGASMVLLKPFSLKELCESLAE